MMESFDHSSYSIDLDNPSNSLPFKKYQEYSIFSSDHNNYKIYDDFGEAYNEIFKTKDMIAGDPGEDSPMINSFPAYAINNSGSLNVVIDSEAIVRSSSGKTEKNKFFAAGSGIQKTCEKLGLNIHYESNKILLSEYKEKNLFKTKEMVKENGKIKAKKKRRKFKPDNIRKKIKARFHKDLKNVINDKIKKAGGNKLFDLLPQSFITNITIKLNQRVLNSTLENLVRYDCLEDTGGKEKNPDRDKYNKNLEVLDYLNENKDISEKIGFDKIKNMKYEELLRAYFTSKEFENSLIEIYEKNKKEKIDYFEEYVNKAIAYVDFFKNPPNKIWENKNDKEENEEGSDSDINNDYYK